MADYWYSGQVSIGVWAKKSGVWSKITEVAATVYSEESTGGQRIFYFDMTSSVDLGPNVEAVGLTVESHNGADAGLTDFVSLTWSSTSISGERSATPNAGQKSTVVVIPQ